MNCFKKTLTENISLTLTKEFKHAWPEKYHGASFHMEISNS